MKTERVYSKNATYQRFEVLKTNRNKRYAYGEFWIEGVRNINEARKNRCCFRAKSLFRAGRRTRSTARAPA